VDHGQAAFSPRTLDFERIDLGRRCHLLSPIYLQMVKVGVVRFNPIPNNPDESFPFILTASMVTVEEVEDEDAPHRVAKKKKKKKPKKKKKSVPTEDKVDVPETSSPPPSSPIIIEPPSPTIPSPPLVVEVPPSPPPTSQAKKKKRQPTMRQPNLTSSSTTTFATMSTAALEQTRAQSAHSYLQSENLTEQKVKVKTRAELSSRPPVQEQDTKRGFFSRFSRKREAAPHTPEETKEKRNLGTWFKNMNRKSGTFLAQILGADKSAKKGGPPMRWDHFVKVSEISACCAFWTMKVHFW